MPVALPVVRPERSPLPCCSDGRHVGFLSAATDLTDDPDTNGADDAFVWSRR